MQQRATKHEVIHQHIALHKFVVKAARAVFQRVQIGNGNSFRQFAITHRLLSHRLSHCIGTGHLRARKIDAPGLAHTHGSLIADAAEERKMRQWRKPARLAAGLRPLQFVGNRALKAGLRKFVRWQVARLQPVASHDQ